MTPVCSASCQRRPIGAGLPAWRLERVLGYIEANLAAPIGLPQLADAAGLSMNYFSAQFQIATGCRPHAYVRRRRIDRAQRMLLEGRLSLIEIALSVGFQSHAHFTTVFRRAVGEAPGRWRQRSRAERGALARLSA